MYNVERLRVLRSRRLQPNAECEPVSDGETSAARAHLAARLRQLRDTDPVAVSAAEEGSGPLPLSPAQRRIWFSDQLEGASSALNVHIASRIRGALHVPALR